MWLPHSFCDPQSLTALLLLLVSDAEGTLTNTTIDGTSSSFSWSGKWTAIATSAPCCWCTSKPDSAQIPPATYHIGEFDSTEAEGTSGSFTFQGSAVYIYGIDDACSQPNIVFELDRITSTYHGHYTGSDQFSHHALFFSATGLAPDRPHTVTWACEPNPGLGKTLRAQRALFDYAIVTTGAAGTARANVGNAPNGGNTGNTGNTGNSGNNGGSSSAAAATTSDTAGTSNPTGTSGSPPTSPTGPIDSSSNPNGGSD
ncbi:hypothetical protein B0H13DRAFT_542983 [Mycena leptocephala]|nr:hypothetical protein B0H13DRAFT_542983 [Mycena leptocephala]